VCGLVHWDKATFHVSRRVNHHNVMMWGFEKPDVVLHPMILSADWHFQFLWTSYATHLPVETTRGTNLMQQLWFIIINYLYMFRASICPSISGCWIQAYTHCARLPTSSLGPQLQHLVLNTICSNIQPVLLKMGI
jgi:hypothetical protein